MRVLIIGGYGTFGRRIAERLCDEPDLELILAGRSLDKAKATCAALSGPASFTPLQLDRTQPLAPQIPHPPDMIVDASGPFQTYQINAELMPDEQYPVIQYALAAGCDYVDISDDGAYTYDVTSLEMALETRRAGIDIVSGLSTCSVFSAIGLREIERVIGPATEVTIGIAPSPKADLGRNVVAAVANYAGQAKVAIRRHKQRHLIPGLTQTYRETICAPGGRPLPRLSFAVADAPDSWVLADDFETLESIWTGAGTRPAWLQSILVGVSHLVAKGLFPKLGPFAGLFHRVRGLFPFGAHRGGMFVRASNAHGAASWHLVAEGDHGPYIPALPTVAYIRKTLQYRREFAARFKDSHRSPPVPRGSAFAGHEVVKLDDLAPELAAFDITYGLQVEGHDLPVYEAVMGEAYARLHPAIADLHRTGEGRVFEGRCQITRGRNPLSHVIAALFRLPKAGDEIPVRVEIMPEGDGERWTRNFAGRRMSSHHSLGQGRQARLVVERFGPIRIHMAVLREGQNLRIETQGWSLFGLPLPRSLVPGGDVYETQDAAGRFVFHVDLIAPLIGRMVKYVGWLEPAR